MKHAKRRRGRGLAGVVIGLLFVATVGAIGLGLRTSLAADDALDTATSAPRSPATTVAADPPVPVERVVVLGDSLVVGAASDLRSLFADHDVELTVVGGVGEGFLSPDAHWLDDLEDAVSRTDPDVVVIEACCNIPSPIAIGGRAVLADSEEAYATWEAAARRAVVIAEARGARVMWVVTPQVVQSSASRGLAGRITSLNEVYAELGVELIDWDAALRDEDERQVRAGDGLHLTGAGSRVVAEATVDAVMAR